MAHQQEVADRALLGRPKWTRPCRRERMHEEPGVAGGAANHSWVTPDAFDHLAKSKHSPVDTSARDGKTWADDQVGYWSHAR